ncbi:MAG: hypothetical protein H6838_10995 [Planctomycetes bacterium]|nr:hypothetical protein [Planctomycetota bacterium]MCB9886013.1 hypothetical protein [Planctomycetota bacterium]
MRTLLCTLLAAAAIPAQTVFSTDFESGMPAEISAGTATLTGVQGYAGLGPTGDQFGGSFLRSETGNTVTLTLTNLPPHNVVHLDFLFAAIDSLDGAGAYPQGDYFRVDVDSQTVFREAFANAISSQIQTYVSPPGVELARHADLGFSGPGGYYTDSAYYLGGDPFFASIAHSGASLTVAFVIEGPGIQPLNDESWAIDNLRIHVGSGTVGTAAAYGTSCGPTLGATSQPAIGQNLDLAMTTLPTGSVLAFAAVGTSSAHFGQFVLPYPLDSQGMPGCWLVMDASLLSAMPFALAGGSANVSIPIPNGVGFVGFQIFAQGWVIAPGSNSVGVVFSNGLRIRIGT